MPWYRQVLEDFNNKLWHPPANLDDLYAWVAFLTAVATITSALVWMVRKAPIAYLGLIAAWQVPAVIRKHNYSASQLRLATELLKGSSFKAQAFVVRTLLRAIVGTGLALLQVLFGVAIGIISPETPAVLRQAYFAVASLAAFWMIYRLIVQSKLRIEALQLAGLAITIDSGELEREHLTLSDVLAKPLPRPWFLSYLVRQAEKARAELRDANEAFVQTVKSLPQQTDYRWAIRWAKP